MRVKLVEYNLLPYSLPIYRLYHWNKNDSYQNLNKCIFRMILNK